jgi:hypothetical protein
VCDIDTGSHSQSPASWARMLGLYLHDHRREQRRWIGLGGPGCGAILAAAAEPQNATYAEGLEGSIAVTLTSIQLL